MEKNDDDIDTEPDYSSSDTEPPSSTEASEPEPEQPSQPIKCKIKKERSPAQMKAFERCQAIRKEKSDARKQTKLANQYEAYKEKKKSFKNNEEKKKSKPKKPKKQIVYSSSSSSSEESSEEEQVIVKKKKKKKPAVIDNKDETEYFNIV
jgi:hypothetical protein